MENCINTCVENVVENVCVDTQQTNCCSNVTNECVNNTVVDLGIPQNATDISVECYGANTVNVAPVNEVKPVEVDKVMTRQEIVQGVKDLLSDLSKNYASANDANVAILEHIGKLINFINVISKEDTQCNSNQTINKVDYNAQYIESLKTEIQNLEAQVKCKESEVDMVKELSGKVSEDYMNLYCLHYNVSKEDFIQQIADNMNKIFNQGR